MFVDTMTDGGWKVIANGAGMWLAVIPTVIMLCLQAIIFIRHAIKHGELAGLTKDDINTAIKAGTICTIGPGMSMFTVMVAFMDLVGAPYAWLRLSIIGTITTEMLGATAGATALGLLLLAGAVLLRHKLVLKFRQERFRQPNRNKAALEAYAFLQRVHKTAKTALHGWDDTIPPQLEELALKARFSQHTLTQEELEPFLEELDKALSLLRERLPKGRRLWCRYGLCLF